MEKLRVESWFRIAVHTHARAHELQAVQLTSGSVPAVGANGHTLPA